MPSTTLYDYAAMASASYAPCPQNDTNNRNGIRAKLAEVNPSGWLPWSIEAWHVGTNINGFQGVIFSSNDEVVCAYKGSKGGFFSRDRSTTAYDDWWVNDIQIGLNQIPSQAGAAELFIETAKRIAVAGNRPVTLVGHSLGGALAQYVGYLRNIPFVTFNAPGMAGNVRARRLASSERGFNMILWKDPVGNFGQHLGKTERFAAIGTTGPAHKMHAVLSALRHSEKWANKTLAQLL
jgi:putative lipase involved disintegration of autophagic bodies